MSSDAGSPAGDVSLVFEHAYVDPPAVLAADLAELRREFAGLVGEEHPDLVERLDVVGDEGDGTDEDLPGPPAGEVREDLVRRRAEPGDRTELALVAEARAEPAAEPEFGPSRALDFELEVGFFTGPGSAPSPVRRPLTLATGQRQRLVEVRKHSSAVIAS